MSPLLALARRLRETGAALGPALESGDPDALGRAERLHAEVFAELRASVHSLDDGGDAAVVRHELAGVASGCLQLLERAQQRRAAVRQELEAIGSFRRAVRGAAKAAPPRFVSRKV